MVDDPLSVTCERAGNRTTIVASGELDETTSGVLVEAAKSELDAAQAVLVDMAGVTFMGSAGVAALVQLHTHARSLQLPFGVREPSRIVRRVIELVRLDEVLLDCGLDVPEDG